MLNFWGCSKSSIKRDIYSIIGLPQETNKQKNSNKQSNIAVAGVAQCIECRPVNQRVTSSIPTQGTCLGCGPGPQ